MLTPEQATDLVEHFGGIRPAAREVGVSYTTFRYWLDPESLRAKRRDRYRAEPEHREYKRAHARDYYEAMDGLAYAKKQLRNRRWAAVRRMAKRERERQWRATENVTRSTSPGTESVGESLGSSIPRSRTPERKRSTSF